MKKIAALLASCLTLACSAQPSSIEWSADFFPPVRSVFGEPQVFLTSAGPAVHFHGQGDGVFLDAVPVAGMEAFTLEVVFRQDGDAAFEQRFLHIGTMELVASPDGLISYVDGVEQCRNPLPWAPLVSEGITSVGVRQNMVCWFKGDLFKLRVTPRVLKPEEFLQDHIKLNGE